MDSTARAVAQGATQPATGEPAAGGAARATPGRRRICQRVSQVQPMPGSTMKGTVRTGQGDTTLSRAEFGKRFRARFYNPAFESLRPRSTSWRTWLGMLTATVARALA